MKGRCSNASFIASFRRGYTAPLFMKGQIIESAHSDTEVTQINVNVNSAFFHLKCLKPTGEHYTAVIKAAFREVISLNEAAL